MLYTQEMLPVTFSNETAVFNSSIFCFRNYIMQNVNSAGQNRTLSGNTARSFSAKNVALFKVLMSPFRFDNINL